MRCFGIGRLVDLLWFDDDNEEDGRLGFGIGNETLRRYLLLIIVVNLSCF